MVDGGTEIHEGYTHVMSKIAESANKIMSCYEHFELCIIIIFSHHRFFMRLPLFTFTRHGYVENV
jgi:hypothetical protein